MTFCTLSQVFLRNIAKILWHYVISYAFTLNSFCCRRFVGFFDISCSPKNCRAKVKKFLGEPVCLRKTAV